MIDIKTRQIILDIAQKKEQIIYGARALNTQLPVYLQKETEDYDILTKKPKKSATELVNALKQHSNGEIEVVKAKHPGTYKVKIKGKTVVDYTQLRKQPKTKNILANKYLDLKTIKRSTQKLAKKKEAEFRREKDISTLENIKRYEMTDFLLN